MRAAKRSENIPLSQAPDYVGYEKMVGANGQTYFAKLEVYGNKYIRNDFGGHLFRDGATLGPHFNAGIHDTFRGDISNRMLFFIEGKAWLL